MTADKLQNKVRKYFKMRLVCLVLLLVVELSSAIDPDSKCRTGTPSSRTGDLKSLKVQYKTVYLDPSDLILIKSG